MLFVTEMICLFDYISQLVYYNYRQLYSRPTDIYIYIYIYIYIHIYICIYIYIYLHKT